MTAMIDGRVKELHVGQELWLGDLSDGTEEEQELIESRCVAVLTENEDIAIVDYKFTQKLGHDDAFRSWVCITDIH